MKVIVGVLEQLVEEAWRIKNVSGWMSFVLKEKLKGLKPILKEWSRKEYGGIEERVKLLVEEIKGLDEKGEEGCWNKIRLTNITLRVGEIVGTKNVYTLPLKF